MKTLLLFVLLLLGNCLVFAQITFKKPLTEEVLKLALGDADRATIFNKFVYHDNSTELALPLSLFYENNPRIFSKEIDSGDFTVFLSTFNFDNRTSLTKKSLIKQGVTYFIEKKLMLELADSYLDSLTGRFELVRFENEFLKPLSKVGKLHFLLSFVDIFEHYNEYNEYILPLSFATVPESEIDSFKTLLNRYLNETINQNYFMYKYVNSSNTFAKAIYIDHGNDFILPINNRDRDLTGSFKFELATDLAKMRLFSKPNRYDILSYQSLFFGGEGYTPFIRFDPEKLIGDDIRVQTRFEKDFSYGIQNGRYNKVFIDNYLKPVTDTIQRAIDRPFASFQYIGRAKYRMPVSGFWRYVGEFKIGVVGKNLSRDIQATIHQNVNPSIKVLNWEKQIGFPGRLAFDIHLRRDRLIYVQGKRIKNRRDLSLYEIPTTINRRGFNFYHIMELNTGTIQTTAALGLGYTNKNFKQQSGQREVNFDSRTPLRNIYISFETKLKYQVHNSLLQGLGFLNTFKNNTLSDVDNDSYAMQPHDLKRIVWLNDLKVSYRINKVAISYTAAMNSQEFENYKFKKSGMAAKEYLLSKFNLQDRLTTAQKEFATIVLDNKGISSDLTIPKFHFYGTVGFNFFIN